MRSSHLLGVISCGALLSLAIPALADQTIFANALDAGWQNWSWDTTASFSASSPVHGGAASLSAHHDAAWGGLYLHANSPISTTGFQRVEFWIHGGTTGGQLLTFALYDSPGHASGTVNLTLAANTWNLVQVPFSSIGSPVAIEGLIWQDRSGSVQPTYYLDDIVLVSSSGPTPTPTPTPPPGVGPALTIDVTAGRHAINPDIYGMNFAEEALAADIRLPVRRFGGNSTTRYNWQLDVSNHASDWYFENIPEDTPNVAALPNGSVSDLFVEQDRRTGTKTIITTPLIGWTPKDRQYRGGFGVTPYGPQTSVDPWRPEWGNGIRQSDGQPVTGNNPTETSTAITPQFTRDWIAHLVGRFGNAASGGVKFYALDNETELWSSTHRDVRPQRLGYDELRDRTYDYAAAIKAQDPTALTIGPCFFGWTAYLYSDLDQALGGAWWNNPLDRNAHGGMEHAAWYLSQMKAYEVAHGVRILDYFDLHYYPQATGVSLSGVGSAAVQATRLRSTRSLWDPTYVDESWIAEQVRLIPRMKDWVTANYPGTKLGISEYNWGALDHINGAVAQADVLGIFGREGLDLATLWGPPTASQPGAYAFRMFRNYDGIGGAYGDTYVSSTSGDQSQLSVYAAQRGSDNAVTIIVVNKATTDLTSTVTVSNFNADDHAKVYRYSAANLSAIANMPDVSLVAGVMSTTFPSQSITTLVLEPAPVVSRVDGWQIR